MTRKPLMVFGGEFWAGASGSGLSEGFRELGWAVQEVDYRHYGARSGNNLPLRVVARATRGIADKLYRERLLKECQTLKPDVFLTIKGTAVTGELLRRIKETGARIVMYYPDFHFEHIGVFQNSFLEYDLFVTTKTFQIPYLESLLSAARVAYVAHGYSNSVHKPVFEHLDEEDYRCNVLYAGNHSAYKQRWIENALADLPDLTFHVIGNRWKGCIDAGVLPRCAALGERLGVSYAETIQLSRINIAIHFGPTSSGWEDNVSTRTFEIPACRGFMLHIDNEEVREFFEPGKEIDVFSSSEELADKIRFYLPRPDLRRRMIDRAYARCVPDYSYKSRARQIESLLATRPEALHA